MANLLVVETLFRAAASGSARLERVHEHREEDVCQHKRLQESGKHGDYPAENRGTG